ncbi:MAG TPA: hypothetical protein VFZ23_16485 [Pyrinomonadaceae bacterium]
MSYPRLQSWSWPAIIGVVLLFLAGLQTLRVNQRHFKAAESEPVPIYTSAGSLVTGTITIPAGEFYSNRLSLNRRLRLTGTFRTANLRNRVSASVIGERYFEDWKQGAQTPTFARTGYVPGGKISLLLEPGAYILLIDNRQNHEPQNIQTDFLLE